MRVSDEEIGALARRLDLAEAEFRAIYTRPLRDGEISLRERRDGSCVFLARGADGPAASRGADGPAASRGADGPAGCTVHGDRPRQCRSWPFWRGVVHSRERWEEEARGCPGMDRGSRFSAAEIEATARRDGTSGRIPRGE